MPIEDLPPPPFLVFLRPDNPLLHNLMWFGPFSGDFLSSMAVTQCTPPISGCQCRFCSVAFAKGDRGFVTNEMEAYHVECYLFVLIMDGTNSDNPAIQVLIREAFAAAGLSEPPTTPDEARRFAITTYETILVNVRNYVSALLAGMNN